MKTGDRVQHINGGWIGVIVSVDTTRRVHLVEVRRPSGTSAVYECGAFRKARKP